MSNNFTSRKSVDLSFSTYTCTCCEGQRYDDFISKCKDCEQLVCGDCNIDGVCDNCREEL